MSDPDIKLPGIKLARKTNRLVSGESAQVLHVAGARSNTQLEQDELVPTLGYRAGPQGCRTQRRSRSRSAHGHTHAPSLGCSHPLVLGLSPHHPSRCLWVLRECGCPPASRVGSTAPWGKQPSAQGPRPNPPASTRGSWQSPGQGMGAAAWETARHNHPIAKGSVVWGWGHQPGWGSARAAAWEHQGSARGDGAGLGQGADRSPGHQLHQGWDLIHPSQGPGGDPAAPGPPLCSFVFISKYTFFFCQRWWHILPSPAKPGSGKAAGTRGTTYPPAPWGDSGGLWHIPPCPTKVPGGV